MKNYREQTIAAEIESVIQAEKATSNYLFIDAGVDPFLNVAGLSENFVKLSKNKLDKHINAEFYKLTENIFDSLRYLSRAIPKLDSVQIFYDGSSSVIKSVVPAVIMARFFGKSITLFYYPGEASSVARWYHYKLFSLFTHVVVGSRCLQREFAKKQIKCAVQLPFVDTTIVELRTINEVQPHILMIHDDPNDSGAVCAMKAFKSIKQKYPRTEMTIVTNDIISWQLSSIFTEQVYYGVNYIQSENKNAVREAFASVDIFVNCDLSESIPLSLVAAMAVGLPSVSYETYGPREIIENGVNGILIRHNDSNQLADRIIELVEIPALAANLSIQAAKIREKINPDKLVRLIS